MAVLDIIFDDLRQFLVTQYFNKLSSALLQGLFRRYFDGLLQERSKSDVLASKDSVLDRWREPDPEDEEGRSGLDYDEETFRGYISAFEQMVGEFTDDGDRDAASVVRKMGRQLKNYCNTFKLLSEFCKAEPSETSLTLAFESLRTKDPSTPSSLCKLVMKRRKDVPKHTRDAVLQVIAEAPADDSVIPGIFTMVECVRKAARGRRRSKTPPEDGVAQDEDCASEKAKARWKQGFTKVSQLPHASSDRAAPPPDFRSHCRIVDGVPQ